MIEHHHSFVQDLQPNRRLSTGRGEQADDLRGVKGEIAIVLARIEVLIRVK